MRTLNNQELKTIESFFQASQSSLKKALTQYLKARYKRVISTRDYVIAVGDIPVALVAHLDTVFPYLPENIYYDRVKNVMWSPDGLGADDRGGVYAINSLLSNGIIHNIENSELTEDYAGKLKEQGIKMSSLNFSDYPAMRKTITEIGNKTLRKLAQSSVLLPFVVSIIIVSYMVRAFLDADTGLLNSLIVAWGGKKTSWYDTPGPWPFILTLVNTWKGAGYGCILYISTIMGIDPSLYEVAHLSGASKLQSIRYVTLPYLKPTIITMVLLNMGRIFNSDFGLFFQVPQNSGMIMDVTQTIDTFVYRGLIVQPNIGMTAAASFLQSCIGFALVLAFNAITRKVSRDDALF